MVSSSSLSPILLCLPPLDCIHKCSCDLKPCNFLHYCLTQKFSIPAGAFCTPQTQHPTLTSSNPSSPKRHICLSRHCPLLRGSPVDFQTCFIFFSNVSSATEEALLQCLYNHVGSSSKISQVLFTPNSPSYNSLLEDQEPQLIVQSGGHDSQGLSYLSNEPFMMINLLNFRSVNVNISKDSTAWVQAGATIGEVYHAIAEKSGRSKKQNSAGFIPSFIPWKPQTAPPTHGNELFPELGLERKHCYEVTWIDSVVFFAGLPLGVSSKDSPLMNRTSSLTDMAPLKAKYDLVMEPIPEEGIQGLWDFLLEPFSGTVGLEPLGGKMGEILASEKAICLLLIPYIVYWEDEGESEKRMDWIRRLYQYMTPYVSNSPRGAYICECQGS
ncbi:hypothetical protein H6P81_019112 [Aristolochia fimbriata]|uniref:Uncharacterized protein n=1 Tax=Aristolochia fimbriata TaxID=158543 RepID=A0AAV7DU00_ARIFI|nr:hypothetical protein H6P81_019112 [Aristolochia fimbriata]